ncbi:MAG: hypothetical protein P0S96_03030 [Simkaniaceae bacterium]|nr:hypothetical protein [Candidatus Sacchlamyda saccharinae]
MNVTAKDVFDFFTPFPNRHAMLAEGVGELLHSEDTSSFMLTCAAVSVYALGILALVRHRLNVGAVIAARVAREEREGNLADLSARIGLNADACELQCARGQAEEALKTLIIIGREFQDLRDCFAAEDDLGLLTNCYYDVIRAAEAFVGQEQLVQAPREFITTLRNSKRTTEITPAEWRAAHETAAEGLIEFLRQAVSQTKIGKLTKGA